jgi:2-polyprenyl-3-methyl-5-hydroxy-6-metoxy-1,4-benzoquinol methylase
MKNDIKKYFDYNVNYWDDLYSKCKNINDVILIERKDLIKKFIIDNLKRNSQLLDVGGGAGVLSSDLINKGYSVDLIDISEKMLNLASDKYKKDNLDLKNNKLIKGNFLEIKIEKIYNCICALGFFEYQKNYRENLRAMTDIVNPGGYIIFNVPIKYNISNFFGFSRIINNIKNNFKNNLHPGLGLKNDIEIKKIIKENNLKIIKIIEHGYGEIYIINKLLPFRFQKILSRMIAYCDFHKNMSFLKSNRIYYLQK